MSDPELLREQEEALQAAAMREQLWETVSTRKGRERAKPPRKAQTDDDHKELGLRFQATIQSIRRENAAAAAKPPSTPTQVSAIPREEPSPM